ncbi:hypothetical protein HDU86_008120 [Geranomyces michiganensis]|nr:hypothetical protein HDU86_008120 [Geranomyces michiganensis]
MENLWSFELAPITKKHFEEEEEKEKARKHVRKAKVWLHNLKFYESIRDHMASRWDVWFEEGYNPTHDYCLDPRAPTTTPAVTEATYGLSMDASRAPWFLIDS